MTLTFGSLFSGIGGLDLGLERAGMVCHWQVEIDPFCRKVLEKHWPHIPKYGDIHDVGHHNLEAVDLICGGFPCQDLSTAGRMEGLNGARSGLHIEFLRIVRELRPSWAIIENIWQSWRRWVPYLRRALWQIEYSSLPVRVRAAEVGAPHIRARCFILAHAGSEYLWQQSGWGRGSNRKNTIEFERAWTQEPPVPGVDDGVPNRLDRNRALGNAVVPQVAELIGRRILNAPL